MIKLTISMMKLAISMIKLTISMMKLTISMMKLTVLLEGPLKVIIRALSFILQHHEFLQLQHIVTRYIYINHRQLVRQDFLRQRLLNPKCHHYPRHLYRRYYPGQWLGVSCLLQTTTHQESHLLPNPQFSIRRPPLRSHCYASIHCQKTRGWRLAGGRGL